MVTVTAREETASFAKPCYADCRLKALSVNGAGHPADLLFSIDDSYRPCIAV